MKYTIQKIFGSYSICVENDYTTMTYYDVQKDIIDIIKQLEQERNNYKELYEKALKDLVKSDHTINELKKWLEDNWKQSQDVWFVKIINKMKDLERL